MKLINQYRGLRSLDRKAYPKLYKESADTAAENE